MDYCILNRLWGKHQIHYNLVKNYLGLSSIRFNKYLMEYCKYCLKDLTYVEGCYDVSKPNFLIIRNRETLDTHHNKKICKCTK